MLFKDIDSFMKVIGTPASEQILKTENVQSQSDLF